MKTKKNHYSDLIELRSEKVRNIIGVIPSVLVRCSLAVIVVIFVILILVAFLVPYPYGNGESIFRHFVH